jgi:hypothetical protein
MWENACLHVRSTVFLMRSVTWLQRHVSRSGVLANLGGDATGRQKHVKKLESAKTANSMKSVI